MSYAIQRAQGPSPFAQGLASSEQARDSTLPEIRAQTLQGQVLFLFQHRPHRAFLLDPHRRDLSEQDVHY